MKNYEIVKAEKIALAVSKLERAKAAHKGLSSEIKNRTKQAKANTDNSLLLGYAGMSSNDFFVKAPKGDLRGHSHPYGYAMATPNVLTACTQIGFEPEEMLFAIETVILALEHSIENLLA